MTDVGMVQEHELQDLSLLYEELIGERSDMEKMREAYRRMAADPRCLLLGARDEGRLIGSVYAILCEDLIGACRPFMVIENVIVSAKARRSGAGRMLMECAEAAARRHGCTYIMLVSAAYRKEAHAFYRALGYDADVRGFKKYLS